MNKEQQAAIESALQGHNLLITGAAGTGKSFVLKEICKRLKDSGNNVHLTCTTGVACAVYPSGLATTVHRYAGLLDVRLLDIPVILNRLVVSAAQINAIFDLIVKKYMMVFLAQFRKDIKTAYKVSKTMAHRKQIKVSKSKKEIKQNKKKDVETPGPSQTQSTGETAQEPVASTSTDSVSAEIVLCKVCQLDHENDDWIQCEKCTSWFHRICAGLKNSRWWKKYSAEGAQWFCKVCKKK